MISRLNIPTALTYALHQNIMKLAGYFKLNEEKASDVIIITIQKVIFLSNKKISIHN